MNEDFITQEFGAEFTSFVKNAKSSKFVPRPQFANKVSHLDKWPQLIKMNAPKIQFIQEHEGDLCIPKAFASVLYYAGFYKVAHLVNNTFNSREDCFSSTDTSYKKIYSYASEILPKWLQCTSRHIKRIRWNVELKDNDIFVGGILGTDGVANHAIAIYNRWIFDANEEYALPLSKDALNYCVSTAEETHEFQTFTGGFFFRERGKQNRLEKLLNANQASKFGGDQCTKKRKYA